jgi:hypothetical protein
MLSSFPNLFNFSVTGNVKGKREWQSYLAEASTLPSSLFSLIGKLHHATRVLTGIIQSL